MKKAVFALLFFILGFGGSFFVPAQAESRLAFTGQVEEATAHINFEDIKVFKDYIKIDQEGLIYARVKSDSMAPLITSSSTVLEKPVSSPSEIKVGDIISFYEPSLDDMVLHMVVDIRISNGEVFYSTKGVANPHVDDWFVPFSNVRGILVGVLR